MKQLYDLTTEQGYKDLTSDLVAANVALAAGSLLVWPAGPLFFVAYKGFKKLIGSGKVSSEKQLEAIEKIVKLAKQEGASKVRVKVSKDVSLSLGAKINGVPVNLKAQADGAVEAEISFAGS